jgi:hypothetical protein
MTLDEAIKHCKEKAKELSNKAYEECGISMTEEEAYDCNECAREHEQLSRWLEDYKRLLEEKRPHGEWIKNAFNTCFGLGEWNYKCNQCNKVNDGKSNFCPHCGADMRGEE